MRACQACDAGSIPADHTSSTASSSTAERPPFKRFDAGSSPVSPTNFFSLCSVEGYDQGMALSNCLIFAVWRWATRGGYLVLRRSHHGWWPHVIWCEDLRDATIEHYVPRQYSRNFAFAHKILFRGYISKVDHLKPMEPKDLLGLKPAELPLPPVSGQSLEARAPETQRTD